MNKRPADEYGELGPQKRRVLHSSSQRQPKSTHSAVDQTYGQRNAFGSLEGNATTAPAGDSDLDCEDEADALAYLRSVREQASTIPHVIVAERAGPRPPPQSASDPNEELEQEYDRSIYNNGTGDFRGYYHDGAYIAYPDNYQPEDGVNAQGNDLEEGEELDHADDDDHSPSELADGSDGPHNSSVDEIRDAYFSSLIQRYLSLRGTVQQEPPDSAITSLPSTHPTEVEAFTTSSTAFTQWSGRLRNTDPLPTQVACMHKDSIIRLVRIILGGKYLRKGVELRSRTSTWIWALLARLPDRGELDYQEVGWVRDLGKRAVLLMIGLAEAQVLQEEYGVGGSDEDYTVEMDIEENLEEGQTPSINEPVKSRTEEAQPDDAENMPEKEDSGDDDDASMDLDDGEVSDDEAAQPQQADADLAAMKARLLAQLDDDQKSDAGMPARRNSSSPIPPAVQESEEYSSAAAQVNVRATLNMILTVAGEFYGQRDLLEFRDPFGTL